MEENQDENPQDDGTFYLTAGGGLTAVALAGVVAGSVCPACVVGAPLLVGYGLYKKFKSRTVQ